MAEAITSTSVLPSKSPPERTPGRLRTTIFRSRSGNRGAVPLVTIADVDRDQFQALQQRARIRNELDMPAARARQDRMAGIARSQAGAHQLIALQLLFTTQAANCLLIRIGGGPARGLDGWFHKSLRRRNSGVSVPRWVRALERDRIPATVLVLRDRFPPK